MKAIDRLHLDVQLDRATRLSALPGPVTETIVTRQARNARNLPPKDPSWMQTFDRVEPENTRLSREELVQGAID
jgi:hypothetical protein